MGRAIAFLVLLALIGLFAAINWPVFITPTAISLGVTEVQAPLGVIMLVLVAFLCVLFTVWVVSLQAAALMDARRQTKELQAQRDLADKAEASRFTELRGELMARFDRLQQDAKLSQEQAVNTVAAHIGELEDRLERGGVLQPGVVRLPGR
ncbi:hypothetical protein BH11PSE8_BH11PSE8_08090 [soil metagenome]